MKRISLLLGLCYSMTTAAAQSGHLTTSPRQANAGEPIALSYTDGPSPSLTKQDTVYAEVLAFSGPENKAVLSVPLHLQDNSWKGTYQPDSSIIYFLIKIHAGNKTDDNNGDTWRYAVVDKMQVPLKNTFLISGLLSNVGGIDGFPVKKSAPLFKESIDNELKLYPGNDKAYEYKWGIMSGNGLIAEVREDIRKVYKENKHRKELIPVIQLWAARLQISDLDINTAQSPIDPKGEAAFRIRFAQLTNGSKEAAKKEIPKLLEDFPAMPHEPKQMLIGHMISEYLAQQRPDQAVAMVEKYDPGSPIHYLTIARSLINKNSNLKLALELCRKEQEVIRSISDEALNALDIAGKATLEATVTNTYAQGLEKAGLDKEALNMYALAYSMTPGYSFPLKENYFALLLKTGNFSKIVSLSDSLALDGYWDTTTTQTLEQALTKLNYSKGKIRETIDGLQQKAITNRGKNIEKESINMPAGDFSLRKTNNAPLKLSELSGKVVVIDFWATWCGPCVESMPNLQKTYDHYRNNPDVFIFALDIGEHTASPEEGEQKMTAFIKTNKYSFLSLYDTDDVAGKYQITAIPRTILIDKKGNIRFITEINDQALNEKIDFLLKDR